MKPIAIAEANHCNNGKNKFLDHHRDEPILYCHTIKSKDNNNFIQYANCIPKLVDSRKQQQDVGVHHHYNQREVAPKQTRRETRLEIKFSFIHNIMIPLVSFLAALRILTHAQSCNNGVGRLVYEKVSDYGLSGLQLQQPVVAHHSIINSKSSSDHLDHSLVIHKVENLTRTDTPVRVLEECLKRCQEDRTTLISRCLSFDFIPGQRKTGLHRARTSNNHQQHHHLSANNETTTYANLHPSSANNNVSLPTQTNDSNNNSTNKTGNGSVVELTASNEIAGGSYHRHQLIAEYEPSKCIFYNERAAPDGQEILIRRNREWHFNEVCLSSSKVISQCQNRLYVFERIPGFKLDVHSMGSGITTAATGANDYKELIAHNRSDCQDKCLNEYRFPCRSATYDRKNKRCLLSKQTRHVNMLAFKPDLNCDYLENNCLTRQQMCHSTALIMETNKELNSIYERDLLHVETFQQCYEQCQMSIETRGFSCRSFMYDEIGQACLIYDEDPFKVVDVVNSMNLIINNNNNSSDNSNMSQQQQRYMKLMNQYNISNDNASTAIVNATSNGHAMAPVPHSMLRSMRPSNGNLYRIICINSEIAKSFITNATIQCFHNKRFNGRHQVEIMAQNFYDCLQECLVRFDHNCKSIEFSSRKKSCKFSVQSTTTASPRQRSLADYANNNNDNNINYNNSRHNNLVQDPDYDYYKFVWHRSPNQQQQGVGTIINRNNWKETHTLDNQLSSELIVRNNQVASTNQQQKQGINNKASLINSKDQPMQSESNVHAVNANPNRTASSTQMIYSGVGSATLNFIPRSQQAHRGDNNDANNDNSNNNYIQYQMQQDHRQHPSSSSNQSKSSSSSSSLGADGNNYHQQHQDIRYHHGMGSLLNSVEQQQQNLKSSSNDFLSGLHHHHHHQLETTKTSPAAPATADPVYTTIDMINNSNNGDNNGLRNPLGDNASRFQSTTKDGKRYHQVPTADSLLMYHPMAVNNRHQDNQEFISNNNNNNQRVDANVQQTIWSNNQHIRTSNPIANLPTNAHYKTIGQTGNKPLHYSQQTSMTKQDSMLSQTNDVLLVPNQFVNLPHLSNTNEKISGYSYAQENSVTPYTYTGTLDGHSSASISGQPAPYSSGSSNVNVALDESSGNSNDNNNRQQQQQQQQNSYSLRYGSALRSPHSSPAFAGMDQSASAIQYQQQQQQIPYDRPMQQLSTAALNNHNRNRIQFSTVQQPSLDPKSITGATTSLGNNGHSNNIPYTSATGAGYSINGGAGSSTGASSSSLQANNNIASSGSSSASMVARHQPQNAYLQQQQQQQQQQQPNSGQVSLPGNSQSSSSNNNNNNQPPTVAQSVPPVSIAGAVANPCKPGFSVSGTSFALSPLESASTMTFPMSSSGSNGLNQQQEPLYSSGLQVVSNSISGGGGAGNGASNPSVRFNRVGSSTRLRSSYIVKVIKAYSLTECERACANTTFTSQTDICRSFNYRAFEAENCEMARHDSRQLKLDNPLYFEQHPQFDYYERDQQQHMSASSLSAAYLYAPASMMAVDCLDVTQSCTPDGMEFTLRTQEPFNGRIYTYGFHDSCFFDGESSTTSVLRISRSNGFPRCGTQQIGDLMTNIVVVQFNDYVQTTRDKKYNLTCYFSGYGEAVVTSNYLDTKIDARSHPMQIEHLPVQNVVTSNVVLRVLYRGQPTNTIALGDLLTFRLEARSQYRYDLLNNEIFATNVIAKDPYTGRQVQLIDSRGCPLDPIYLFPELQKTPDGALESEFYAFKIPDSNFLIFQATVRTCKSPCEPIICSDIKSRNGVNSVPSWGRRKRRRRDTLAGDEEVSLMMSSTKNADDEFTSGQHELDPNETIELHTFTVPARLRNSNESKVASSARLDLRARNLRPDFQQHDNMQQHDNNDKTKLEQQNVDVAEEEVQEMFRVYASRDDIPKQLKSANAAQLRHDSSKTFKVAHLNQLLDNTPEASAALDIRASATVCLSQFGYYSMVACIVSLTLMITSVVCVTVYIMKRTKFSIKQVDPADSVVSPVSMRQSAQASHLRRAPVSSFMMYSCLL